MASWERVGVPGGEYRLATYDDGLAVIEAAVGPRGSEAFAKAPHAAARADLFRYAELLRRGGWYVDAEDEALLPLPDTINRRVVHVFVRRGRGAGFVTNSFIGAAPGSALLRAVLEEACTNVLGARGDTILELTGPILFSRHVLAYAASPGASYLMLPAGAVFDGVLQVVHNEADYKVRSHWRDHHLGSDTPDQSP